jgi:hypothetical protein
LAVCVPDSFAFAKARKFLTSSFDHAKATRFFRFAMNTAPQKSTHHSAIDARRETMIAAARATDVLAKPRLYASWSRTANADWYHYLVKAATPFPLRQLVTDPLGRFQLRFAQQGAVLLDGFDGIQTEASAAGLLVKAVAERDLHAATAMLRVGFAAVRVGPVEIVYLNQGTMEPYVRVRVTTPADYYGDVVAQLTQRRGLLESLDDAGEAGKIVCAAAPLAEMLGYDEVLAANTRNRAIADYHFIDYRPVRSTPPTPPASCR